jgi:hypothetical protein
VRLAGAILIERNDGWAVQRARYMTLETIAQVVARDLVVARWPEKRARRMKALWHQAAVPL